MKFFACEISLEPYSVEFYEVKGKREGLTDVDEDGIVTYSSISFEDAKKSACEELVLAAKLLLETYDKLRQESYE